MLQPDVSERDISVFNGANLRLDPYAVPLSNGFYSQNTGYLRGQAGTRLGHSTVVNTSDGAITNLINWYFISGGVEISVALYYAPSVGIKGWQQIFGFTTALIPQTSQAGASMVPAGTRLYAAFFTTTGRLSGVGGQVYGWNIGNDPLFAAPITNTPTISQTGAGLITAGVHRIGFLYTTRNGYTGRPCPVNSGGVFSPVSFTSTGSKNLQVSIPGTFPTYLAGGTTAVQVVMSTVANPNRYYTVPGAIANVLTNPTNITISISDDDLSATGTDVTKYMNLLTSAVGGGDPFEPSALAVYSSRMSYLALDVAGNPFVAFSDPFNYQFLTADQHLVYLDALAQPIVGFGLRGVYYIGTLQSLFSIEDNGDVPVTWTPPQVVDGSIGILSPTCIIVNPAEGYAAIASDRGFYIFQGGVFPPLPISYMQASDWNRINWKVPTTVQLVDDQFNKRLIVLAPLSNTVASVSGTGPYTVTTGTQPHLYQTGLSCIIAGVTGAQSITVTGPNTFTIAGGNGAPTVGGSILPQTASHRMSWDYTEGDTPDTVKYSIDNFLAYNTGALAKIKNVATYVDEVWYAPSASGYIIRQNDGSEALPYQDVSTTGTPTAISWLYETSLVPGPAQQMAMTGPIAGSTVHDFHGMHIRAFGTGPLSIQVFSLDHAASLTPIASPLPLAPGPGKEYLVKWFLRSEQMSIRVGTNGIGQNAVVSLIRAYYTNSFSQR